MPRAASPPYATRLCGSRVAYGGLAARGTHPAYEAEALAQRCPGVPPRVLHRLRRTCSALAWWSPVFAECEGLPALALPFVRAFAADDVGAFEALATVLLHVTPNWFRDFPNPPMHVISTVEARARAAIQPCRCAASRARPQPPRSKWWRTATWSWPATRTSAWGAPARREALRAAAA